MTTALDKYQRLEASGLWRASPDEQRKDVIVSIGDATLIITDMQDRALTHWSLPAVRRRNPGTRPAVYHPDGDPGETLEIAADETEMIEAIEKLRTAVARQAPKPGRLRTLVLAGSVLSIAALAVFWLPGALLNHALGVVPEAKRQDIGDALLEQATRLTGTPCHSVLASSALRKLEQRLNLRKLVVVPSGVPAAAALPGGIVLVNRNAIEDYEEPDVVAGFIIAENLRNGDPLRGVLQAAGISASFRLLTTGDLSDEILRAHAETLVLDQTERPADEALITAFAENNLRISPYAYALDPSGETTLSLIEADPFTVTPEPVLSDGDWVALQGICDG
ncbi:hypothetical protein [Shimia aestuarii]|uniref:Uncharacterized protein n=1 Tax=Shimia aestuarii TaxID=254406 RepID=A0A1I4REA5_9RHOB|nr:hypothetical protein [Shimia aestuarii]SFM50622.1 hypothetical protein SAMN04488042_10845 [Shimia aestuarii]